MILEILKDMWPVTIRPIIDGIAITYHSNTETFEYNNAIYHLKLGKKTYNPINGYLVVSKIDLEKMNYKRAQNNLELFSHVTSAVKYILNTKEEMHTLLFVASGVVDSEMLDETRLLKKLGYFTIMHYSPATIEEAMHFLETFSMYQTQEQRSNCFGLSSQVYFIKLAIEKLGTQNNSDTFIFCNQNLAVTPCITEAHNSVNYKGEIMTHFKFTPIEILGQTFSGFIKPYGVLEYVTLIDNMLYDLTTHEAPALEKCPCCNEALVEEKCANPICKDKVIFQANRMACKEFLNIKGLSQAMLGVFYDYMIENSYIMPETLHDLFFFELPLNAIDDLGLKKLQSKLLKTSLAKAQQTQKLCDIIYSLDITGMDKKSAKFISEIVDHDIRKIIFAIEHSDANKYPYVALLSSKLEKLKYFDTYIERIN